MDGAIKGVIIIGIGIAGAYRHVTSRPVVWKPGYFISDEPVQRTILSGKPWEFNGYTITPLATYDISARVVHRQRYYFDSTSRISPLDLGLAWGKGTDQKNLDQMSFTHNDRFLSWSFQNQEMERFVDEISNVHLLPADASIRGELLRLKVGQGVRLIGKLISASKDNGNWTSSLSRTDQGDGACEIMWVEKVFPFDETKVSHD